MLERMRRVMATMKKSDNFVLKSYLGDGMGISDWMCVL